MDVLTIPADTIASGTAAADGWTMHPSKFSVIRAVTRRLVPYLIEATVIPTVLFYVMLGMTGALRWALIAALIWSYSAVARRLFGRQPIPGLLVLATLGISLRTVIYLLSNNSFIYFVQPILRTVVTATVFAASVLVGRPLIARFAADFCPLEPEVLERPAIQRLFRRLTYLWAAVNALIAAVSLTLLLTVPVPVFVGAAAVSAWVITCTGVVFTVSDAVCTARNEGLATAVGPNGNLQAYAMAPVTA
ncbi:MAG: VC0807 family protein [Ilumatobacteraceae bacterium]